MGVEGDMGGLSYATYDRIMAREMGFAVLAAEDLVRVQVDVVREPHPGRFEGGEAEERRVKDVGRL